MIIQCAECGGCISDKAYHCPHCGAPVNAGKPHVIAVRARFLNPDAVGHRLFVHGSVVHYRQPNVIESIEWISGDKVAVHGGNIQVDSQAVLDDDGRECSVHAYTTTERKAYGWCPVPLAHGSLVFVPKDTQQDYPYACMLTVRDSYFIGPDHNDPACKGNSEKIVCVTGCKEQVIISRNTRAIVFDVELQATETKRRMPHYMDDGVFTKKAKLMSDEEETVYRYVIKDATLY